MKKYFFGFLFLIISISTMKATDTEEFIVNVEDNNVTIIHKNLWANCCSIYETEVKIDDETNTIIVIERDTSEDKCHCMCLFDLETKINNLAIGNYKFEIWREELKKFMYSEDKLFKVWAGKFEITAGFNMPPIAMMFDQSDCKGMSEVNLDYPLNQSLTVSPNPVNNNLQINLIGAKGETAKLLIFDIAGRIIQTDEIKLANEENTIEISADNFAQGAYYGIIEIKGEISEFCFNIIR